MGWRGFRNGEGPWVLWARAGGHAQRLGMAITFGFGAGASGYGAIERLPA